MRHRYLIVGMMALASFWLYIDRVCFSTLAKPMTGELLLALAPEPDAAAMPTPAEIAAAKRLRPPSAAGVEDLTAEETRAALKRRWADRRMSYALGAFFLTYALFQIPMGSLADRHGARLVLALSIAAWSLVTMATGFVVGFLPLLAIRLLLGITEAGAYPAAAGLLKAWVPQQQRGRCSSVVTLGGRLGGAIAPRLTATLAAALAGLAVVEWVVPRLASTAAPAGPNWRGVFFIYGLCGLAVALLFWVLVRDRPPVPLATEPGGTAAPQRPLSGQMALLATSRNMWLAGALQFGVNLGWAFIVTLLPTYLAEVFDTPLEQIGTMQTVTLAIGCVGMLFGGAFTDLMRSRLGPRFGRSVPVGIALAGCTASFLLVPALPNAWLVILALGAMAFCVDMLVPPLWSFIQDVGGRNVGAALGWGNMWGNLGAALSPVLLTEIRQAAGWNAAFLCCGAACGLGALCGFMLDATRPVDPEPAVPPAVRRTGLTLIELLVVVAVIAALVGLLLPTLQSTREGGRRAACSNNLRQLGLAFHAHHDAVGTLPYTRLDRHETWAVVIMPFCEQSAAHSLWDLSRPYYEQAAVARLAVQAGLLCPTRRGGNRALSVAGDVPQALIAQGGSAAHVPGACSDYAVCTGDHAGLADYYAGYKGLPAAEAANGTFLYKAGQIGFRRVTDGLAHTILAGEKHVPNHGFGVVGDVDGTRNQDGSVYNGDYFQSCTAAAGAGLPIADGPAGSGEFGSYHPGVCPFVMGDGSVRHLVASTDAVTLARLANRHDGQAVVLDH